MALLTPPDILPEAMRFIIRTLLAYPDQDVQKAELLALVAPRGLVEAIDSMGPDAEAMPGDESDLRSGGAVIVSASLDALRRELHAVRQEGDQLSLSSDVVDRWKRPTDVTARAFSDYLLEKIFEAANPQQIFGDAQGVMDLVQALVILHTAKEPFRPFERFEPPKNDSGPARRNFIDEEQSRLGNERTGWPIPNKEQWLTLQRWAPYIGLARPVGSNGLIPDASVALTRRLVKLPPGDYNIQEFVSHCASAVPILDGGILHSGHDSSQSGDHEVLSPGLSVSLLQLEADGALNLPNKRSDTASRTVRITSDELTDRSITNVVWHPEQQKKRGKK